MKGDVVHAALQFPSSIVQIMVAILMLMRWRWVMRSEPNADPRVSLLLGLLLLVLGTKQTFWMLHGVLLASDLDGAANVLRGHWLPGALNALVLVFGALLIARVGQPIMGRMPAYASAVGSSLGLVVIGALLATWG